MTRRRKYLLIGIVPVLIAALPLIWLYYQREQQFAASEKSLQEAIAQLDREDPNWRWDDLAASRPPVPDQENLLLRVRSLGLKIRLGPQPFNSEIAKNELPSPEEMELLDAQLKNYQSALQAVRSLSDLEKSRIPISPSTKPLDIVGPFGQFGPELRETWGLLDLDARLALLKNDPTTAIRDIKGILVGAHSIHEELTLLIHLIRQAGISIACGKIEHLLALTEPKEQLQELIPILDKMNAESFLFHGIRGERAFGYQMFEEIEPSKRLAAFSSKDNPVDAYHYRPYLKEDFATYLRTLTEITHQFKKPLHEVVEWARTYQLPNRPNEIVLTPTTIPAHMKVVEAEFRTQSRIELCRVAIAVELFRVQKGRWPKDLQELPQSLLPKKPIDPYDGKSLRYRVIDDGVLVYSIGLDRIDHRGDIPESAHATTKQLLFRLWNPEQRRKPAPTMPEVLPLPMELNEEGIKP